ncbi:hypothetical protein Aab01nite_06660 [Paractinoplanes abujensis]|uniref:Uncharacterized protein (TIGR02246 family) n=1 Tax=Paractinoplanes abujensis TaxID=882441 RepID=A0A7W7G0D5_9ACTN|nr:nuclear transport factor 2 family protein [Actinoplanes abujensis]MBB4691507.1 uncharacterized protein (TIGR02246 family) [Actinoplanes abujensis]GID17076.1 hypothetical protein Aab01nite_06660 [Actinoplanes abujensis]
MEIREAARRWAQTWRTGWPAQDVEAIARLHAPDGDYYASMFRPYAGRHGLRDYLTECFGVESRPAEVWFDEPRVDGDTAAVEYWAVTYPHGEPLTVSGCTVLRFDDAGLVTEARDYSHVREGRFSRRTAKPTTTSPAG